MIMAMFQLVQAVQCTHPVETPEADGFGDVQINDACPYILFKRNTARGDNGVIMLQEEQELVLGRNVGDVK